MCGVARTRSEAVVLDRHAFHATVHLKRHTLPPEEGFVHRQSFFVIFGFKCGFRGLLGAAEPPQRRTVAQKIGCLVLHMFCCGFAGGFSTRPFLKMACTDFGGGGLVQAVLERPCGRW